MNIAILLSGGSGTRAGLDMPKQYAMAGSQRIIDFSLNTLINHKEIDGLVVVCESTYKDTIKDTIRANAIKGSYAKDKPVLFCDPGKTRQLSIYNGLQTIAAAYPTKDIDLVFIHDAARPNLSAHMVSTLIETAHCHDGAMPVLPMKDTVYISQDGKQVSALIDRKTLYAGQAPEVFNFNKYLHANKALMPDRILDVNGSSEPAVLEGMDIALVEGDEHNYKITTKEDYLRFINELSSK